jgi:1-phosphatidylinositol-4-phosphate 5-kinase
LYSINNNQEAKQKQQVDCEERVFLVMNSVFPAEASAFVTERFDLKGSTVGRDCSLEEQRAKGANAVLKDLNLKREVDADRFNKKEQPCGIHIGKQKKCAFMAQLKKDVDLLHRCGVLDYSLLVGSADMEKVSDFSEFNKSKKKAKLFPQSILHNLLNWMDAPMPYHGACKPKVDGGHLSCLLGTRRGKQVTYYMGIIDFLQPWTVKKRLERDLKGLAGYDTSAISCVAPSDYAARFLKFMDAHIT